MGDTARLRCYSFFAVSGDQHMTVQAQPGSLERELEYRKKLTGITNQINSAESIPHILMTLKDKILELLDAERLTIYAIDTKNQELYSLQKTGDQPKEIRVPKSFASIAGFTALHEEGSEELARILGIAFYNQHRSARQTKPSKFGGLVDKGVVSEKDIEAAVSSARGNNSSIEKVLMEDYSVPKEEIGKSLATYYNSHFFNYDGMQTIPSDLRERVPSDMWKKYVCAPVERRPGVLVIAVDDPQDLTRLDGIRAMGLSPRYDFIVGMKDEILQYIPTSYGEKAEVAATEGADLAKIIDMLGEGDAQVEEEEAKEGPEIDETDSGIVRLVNQLIIEAFNRGASDIHVEPEGAKLPCLVRLRIDGDCIKFMEIHGPHRNAVVQRLKIIAKLDISELHQPPDGKIRFQDS